MIESNSPLPLEPCGAAGEPDRSGEWRPPDLSKTTGTHDPTGFDVAERFSGACAQRRFPTAVVLSAIAVAVAGGGEIRLPGACRRGRGIRPVRAFAIADDEASERHRAAGIREAGSPAGVHPVQRVPARWLQVRILRIA